MLSPPRMLAVLVGAALLLSGGLLGTVQYAALADYESTTGTVERATIENYSAEGASGLSLIARSGETLYVPNVSYTYTVDGETYTGRTVASRTDMVMGDRTKLSAALATVEPGTRTVYYHPSEPADAHLLQSLAFFPAGMLALCGLLAIADGLTPRVRLVRLLTALFPLETLEQLPGVDTTPATGFVENPTEILTAKRTWAGVDPAPFRGSASVAVWLLCYLFITDLIVAYFLVSSPPYDLWAVAAAAVVVAGVARLGFSRVLD